MLTNTYGRPILRDMENIWSGKRFAVGQRVRLVQRETAQRVPAAALGLEGVVVKTNPTSIRIQCDDKSSAGKWSGLLAIVSACCVESVQHRKCDG
jgi:hypothetical protein